MAKFEPGRSGNPAGRPKGVKDKRNELRDLDAGVQRMRRISRGWPILAAGGL